MSILETPRLYFRGQISWDPVTTNNFPPKAQMAGYNEATTDSTLNASPITADQVAAYRKAAIDEVNAGWNPDGTYRSKFFETQVNGVDVGAGLDTRDPVVTAPVGFQGMLIDAEPYGAYTSQLFFDEMSFGIPGGCRIVGKRARRFDDRNINFQANPSNAFIAGSASVTWQTVFPKRGHLIVEDQDSPLLQAFNAALSSDDVLGLMVRWNAYRTVYYNDPDLPGGGSAEQGAALQKKLQEGGFQPNPARSLVVGALGLWRRGDCATEPGERTLVSLPVTIDTGPAKGARVGTAFMKLNADADPPNLTLDFQNTIPCADQQTEKADLGTLSVIAADPPPAVAMVEFAQIPYERYNRAAYEATGGLIKIDLPDLLPGAEDMVFSIKAQGDGPTYLDEVRYRALPDEPNVYANESEARQLRVQVYDRGRPAGAGLTVTWSPLQDAGSTDTTHWSATTDATGAVYLHVDTSKAQIYAYVFQVGDSPVLPVVNGAPTGSSLGFNPMVNPYAYIRVLPQDADIAAMEPSWENVYGHVLANFNAIAPCMDNWLRLDDEQQVRAYAPLVKRLTDPAAFEEFRYMPPTRDLTPGARTLLYNWLDGAGDGATAKSRAGLQPASATSGAQEVLDAGAASRAHRSGPA
ncbi:MAG: hypothetical protein RKE49_10095 [Oceanicaulis sp.]